MHTRAVYVFMLGPEVAWHAHVMYLEYQDESRLHGCAACQFVGLTNFVPCEGTKKFIALISHNVRRQGLQPMHGQNK